MFQVGNTALVCHPEHLHPYTSCWKTGQNAFFPSQDPRREDKSRLPGNMTSWLFMYLIKVFICIAFCIQGLTLSPPAWAVQCKARPTLVVRAYRPRCSRAGLMCLEAAKRCWQEVSEQLVGVVLIPGWGWGWNWGGGGAGRGVGGSGGELPYWILSSCLT